MKLAQREMDAAVETWLESYRGHERYLAATENLFEVFAQSWQGSRRYIAEAFTEFRKALLRQHGIMRSADAPVFTKQSPEHE